MNGATIFGKPALIGECTNKGARDKRNDDRMAAFTGPNGGGQQVQYLVVADGVTSTHGGDQASDIAVRRLQQVLEAPSDRLLTDRMADAIQQANQAIVDAANENPEFKGMSTTLVLAAVEGERAYIMHLGDSRAYLLRGGQAYQLTLDHTWIQDALDEGRVTPEQAANHPNRHVIQRFLGAPRSISIDPRIIEPGTGPGATDRRSIDALPLAPGDALLLCSDGLYGRVSAAEFANTIAAYPGQPQKAAEALVQVALKRSEPDNITALLWTTGGAPVAAAAGGRKGILAWGLAGALALLAIAAAFLLMGRPAGSPGGAEVAAADAATAASISVNTGNTEALAAGQTAAAAQTPAESEQPPVVTEPAGAEEAPAAIASTDGATAEPGAAAAGEELGGSGGAADAAPLPATSTAVPASGEAGAGTPADGLATATPGAAGGELAASGGDQPLAAAATSMVETLEGTVPVTGSNSAGSADAAASQDATATSGAAANPPTEPTGSNRVGSAATPSRTVVPTSTPLATSTPLPSPTASPTRTPTPTAAATATRVPTRVAMPTPAGNAETIADSSTQENPSAIEGGPTSVTIKFPQNNHNTTSSTKFDWTPNAPLEAGQVFEVAFWQPGESPEAGKSWVPASSATEVEISSTGRSGSYRWGVWLGTFEGDKYRRIRYLGADYTFTVSSGSSGGSGGGSGGAPVPPEPPSKGG